ncbi:glutathione S-transferase family protein [Sphingobium subterraneum]|uniref:Glutathione S-transferase n=1 Tax=Sphingobium subterraneum TaxID=627688 RepID=A0A841J1T1_9SPHN|nr:glutathione S-transferase [Sphingobium subterraneum]MBB6122498.1 glutathione S-transferase [Sphingobium subterraneum]
MDALIFYTNPMSRGQIVRWMLEEVGVSYEQRLLDYPSGMKSAEYLAINPMGKVPAIVHDGRVVTECAAICAYLADAFPEAGLAPPTSDRADYYRWLFFAAGPVENAVTNHAMQWNPSPDQSRTVGYGSYETTIDALETAVAGKSFVANDTFSAADVYLGSHIDWGMQFGTIPQRPVFERYIAPLRERAAYRRAKEIDGALIAKAQRPADR